MSKEKIIHALRYVLKRTAILYIFLFVAIFFVIDFDKLRTADQVERLNELLPDFAYLSEHSLNGGEFDEKKLRQYFRYYKKVNKFFPEKDDVLGMLGFLYYHKGDFIRSEEAFKKSIDNNPHMFWTHYNLGLLHFSEEKYDLAADAFNSAIVVDPRRTIYLITESDMYRRILQSTSIEFEFAKRYEQAVSRVYSYLAFIYEKRGDFNKLKNVSLYALETKLANKALFNYYLGLAHFRLNQHNEAVQYFRASIDAQAENVESFHHLGLTLQALGQNDLATKVLQKGVLLRKQQVPLLTELDLVQLQIF